MKKEIIWKTGDEVVHTQTIELIEMENAKFAVAKALDVSFDDKKPQNIMPKHYADIIDYYDHSVTIEEFWGEWNFSKGEEFFVSVQGYQVGTFINIPELNIEGGVIKFDADIDYREERFTYLGTELKNNYAFENLKDLVSMVLESRVQQETGQDYTK